MKGPAASALIALLAWGFVTPKAGHGQAQVSGCVFALARAGEQIQATGAVVSNVRRGEEASTNNPFPFKGDKDAVSRGQRARDSWHLYGCRARKRLAALEELPLPLIRR